MYPIMLKLSRGMAYLGGAMLVALILLTCASVLGRALNGMLHAEAVQSVAPRLAEALLALGIGPVNGDFELVEAGVAFAIFAFLPLCQITGGHATVDLFADRLPDPLRRLSRAMIEAVFAAVVVLIAVQLASGMQSKMQSGQTTLLIEFPLWWAYALSLAGAGLAAVIAVYVAALRLAEAVTGRPMLPEGQGAET